mmetsp:Transcript_41406/g.50371  ORF Transcript_41406/g.50371 Transcript_41406/m.50371 type:complete len:466 (-) Transcript_41406:207-1604(-)
MPILLNFATVSAPLNDGEGGSEGETIKTAPPIQQDVDLFEQKRFLLEGTKSPKKKKQHFPMKLMEILTLVEENGISNIINWCPDGKSFIILKIKPFTETVLPNHFHLSNFASFRQMLSRWGFKHVLQGPDAGAIFHPMFLRENPALCILMKCQKTRGMKCSSDLAHDEMGRADKSLSPKYSPDVVTSDDTACCNDAMANKMKAPQGIKRQKNIDESESPPTNPAPRRVTMDTVISSPEIFREASEVVPYLGISPYHVSAEITENKKLGEGQDDLASKLLMEKKSQNIAGSVFSGVPRRATMCMADTPGRVSHLQENRRSMQQYVAMNMFDSRQSRPLPTLAAMSATPRRATMDTIDSTTHHAPVGGVACRRVTMDMSSSFIANQIKPLQKMTCESRQMLIDTLRKEQAANLMADMVKAREIYTTSMRRIPGNDLIGAGIGITSKQDEKSRIIEAALDAAYRSGML